MPRTCRPRSTARSSPRFVTKTPAVFGPPGFSRSSKLNQVFGDKKAVAIFVLPAFFLFLLVGFVPIVQSVIYSLQDWDGIQPPTFAGLQSYIDMFTTDSFGVAFG